MKTSKLFLCALVVLMGITMSSCNKADDYSKFTASELVGKWVYPQYEDNEVWGYLDIKQNTAELFINEGDWDALNSEDIAYYKDGKLIEGELTNWESYGVYPYTFDEKDQTLYSDNLEIVAIIGTSKLATLKRTGKDEAEISSAIIDEFLSDEDKTDFDVRNGGKVYRVQ